MNPMTNKADVLTPYLPDDPLLCQAWVDCLMWAVGFEPIMKRFREETGITYTPARSPIDQMIDEATGHQEHFVREFVKWFDTNVWGTLDTKEPNPNDPTAR
jgi:hypothetical protein